MEIRILRLPDVIARTGLSRTRVYDLEREGRFPRRRKISDRASGWLESEVNEWIESRPFADGEGAAA